MSTGLECEFIEPEEGKWFYLLEDYSAPKMAWDWRDYATAYGPFPSYDAACEHLSANHANPGGHSTSDHTCFAMDSTYQKLIAEANERARRLPPKPRARALWF